MLDTDCGEWCGRVRDGFKNDSDTDDGRRGRRGRRSKGRRWTDSSAAVVVVVTRLLVRMAATVCHVQGWLLSAAREEVIVNVVTYVGSHFWGLWHDGGRGLEIVAIKRAGVN